MTENFSKEKIWAINYADANFCRSQKLNTWSAKHIAKVGKVVSYSPDDLDRKFREENQEIFSQKRGGGYWLWKPYLILRTLNQMEENAVLVYSDSGGFFVKNIRAMLKYFPERQDVMCFEIPLKEKAYTKRLLFERLRCTDKRFHETNQIIGTYLLIKNTTGSREFVQKWLEYSKIPQYIMDKSATDGFFECADFVEHRHDQSIFSLLCKLEGIHPSRDPEYPPLSTEHTYGQTIVFARASNEQYIKRMITALMKYCFLHVLCIFPKTYESWLKRNGKYTNQYTF